MALALPNNLFAMALSRFDKLVDEGQIIYGTSHPEYIERDGFEVHCSWTFHKTIA
jgi:hypothetical protein